MDAATAASSERTATDRASLRTMRRRRRRVWLNLLAFFAVTALMVVLVMARRDEQEVSRCQETLRAMAADLQEKLAASQGLPVLLRDPAEGLMPRSHYLYRSNSGPRLRDDTQSVGIVCCDQTHRLFLRRDGRHVIIGRGNQLSIEWFTLDGFNARAAELGLPLIDGDSP